MEQGGSWAILQTSKSNVYDQVLQFCSEKHWMISNEVRFL